MDNKTDHLPHQLLIECEILLQDIAEKSIDTYEDFNRVLEELYEKEMSKQFLENLEE